MTKRHICDSTFLSPWPEFCEPFWWITEPERGDCGNPQMCTWLAQSVVAWAPHVQLASERGLSHRNEPFTLQDLILPPGSYNQTSIAGYPGGVRELVSERTENLLSSKCPKWDSWSCPPSIPLLDGPFPQGVWLPLVTAHVQILKAPPAPPFPSRGP